MKNRDPKAVAYLALTNVHGNRIQPKARCVQWEKLFADHKRSKDEWFSPASLSFNIGLTGRTFAQLFSSFYKDDIALWPLNLRKPFEDAWTGFALPSVSPWRDYLYTMSDAEEMFVAVTGYSAQQFRRAVTENRIPHYRFSSKIRRFRKEELEAFFRNHPYKNQGAN